MDESLNKVVKFKEAHASVLWPAKVSHVRWMDCRNEGLAMH